MKPRQQSYSWNFPFPLFSLSLTSLPRLLSNFLLSLSFLVTLLIARLSLPSRVLSLLLLFLGLPTSLYTSLSSFSISQFCLFPPNPLFPSIYNYQPASSSLFLIFSLSIYSFYLPQYRSILYPPLVSHFPHTPSHIYPSLFIYFIKPSLYVFPIKRFHI